MVGIEIESGVSILDNAFAGISFSIKKELDPDCFILSTECIFLFDFCSEYQKNVRIHHIDPELK